MSTTSRTRVRARVEGVVQGVGFRPFVHRLAHEHALAGWVRNDERGVLLEVEGEVGTVECFLERLAGEPPPLAVVERVRNELLHPNGEDGFRILGSGREGEPAALVSPDVAPCEECLAELFDPGDRRYRYPFINCTNCGPRFTIVRGVPYDRPLTTMAAFALCATCLAEYEDPANRRFHAQPNACPACGPTVAADRPAPGPRSELETRSPPRPRRCSRGRSSRSRVSAATTSLAWRRTSGRSQSCDGASAARRSRSRLWHRIQPPCAGSFA